MKNSILPLLAGLLLLTFACSEDDDPVNDEPIQKGISVEIDGEAFIATDTRVMIDTAQPQIRLPENIKVISQFGNDKGLFVAIALEDGKLEPGSYALAPGSDKNYAAQIFYAEDLDKEESVNYASYYVPVEDQDGEVIITSVDEHHISGTFRGKVLTAFGDVDNPTKIVTEGKINVEY